MLIALGHKSRVGKDTAADTIGDITEGTIHRLSFAKPLYEIVQGIQRILNVELKKDGTLMQRVGTILRTHYGPDVFVRILAGIIDEKLAANPDCHIIVTDVRLENEFDMLKSKNFTMIKIDRSDRPIDRDPNHISETALDNAIFDHVIENDGTIESFREKIVELLKK